MASEFRFHYTATGSTLYIVLGNASGQFYNGSTYEAPLTADWTTYKIALTEQSTTRFYYGNMPSTQSAGLYDYYVYLQAGGSAAVTDTQIGQGRIDWSGTADTGVGAGVNLVQIDGNATSGNNATLNLKQLNIVNSAGSAVVATSTGSNGDGLTLTGHGTNHGMKLIGGATGNGLRVQTTAGDGFAILPTGGDGIRTVGSGSGKAGINCIGSGGSATGPGMIITTTATNANGLQISGIGTGAGLTVTGGATGNAVTLTGGATSGIGLSVLTTSGDGVSITPTAGNAITATANGTSKHGLVVTGGTAGTSDGVKAVAGTGGVDLRAAITGNVTGNLSGSVGSVATGGITAASFAASAITATVLATDCLGSAQLATSAVTEIQSGLATSANVTALLASIAAVQSDTDDIQTRLPAALVSGRIDASIGAYQSGQDPTIRKGQALANFEFVMIASSDHVTPLAGLTVTAQRSLDGAAFAACTNSPSGVSDGIYKLDLSAADLNGDTVTLLLTATAADPTIVSVVTQP